MPRQSVLKNAAKVEVFLRAEDCAHWRKPNAESGEPSMSESGHDPKSLVDIAAIPNIAKLARGNQQELLNLGSFLEKLDESKTRILLKLIVDSYRLRSTGFWFGQPVYWCSSGEPRNSYLDQWFSCVVLGMNRPTRGKIQVVVSASLGVKTTAESLVTVNRKSLVSESEFDVIRDKLESANKLETPKRQRNSVLSWSQGAQLGDEPPSLSDILTKLRAA